MTRQLRIVAAFCALWLSAAIGAAGCRSTRSSGDASTTVRRGGELTASVRTEPQSFNRFAARDSSTDLVSELTQARLVRINKATKEVEPWLAESWTADPDGRRYTIKLRPSLTFSDGSPLTAADVEFTFTAAYDEKSATVLADSLLVGGKPLRVRALDPQTVEVVFPEPFAPGLRLLDNVPIYPSHKLAPALAAGTFTKAWNLATPVTDIVGAGPFVLREYVPGQRVAFERNPHYWRKAADGTALPYLDRITVEIAPDQNAELLRLQSGQLDAIGGDITPDAYAPVKRAADEGRLKLYDLGVGYQADSFWFNLKPGAFAADPRSAWLQRDELRRAISLAVDRKVFADTVFLGAGDPVYGPETPANRKWYWSGLPRVPHDPAAAKAQLASIGLTDRNGDGMLEDAANRPARFTLVTQKGRPKLERGAAVIRDELKKVGLTVDVALLDGNAVIQRIVTGQYEAAYFAPQQSDTDPAINQDFWLSSGSSHLWNMGQAKPATDWERQIDDLMKRQIASSDQAERKRLYDDVQRIFAEHVPVVYFVAPRFFVAVSSRVLNATPAIYTLPVLWSADTLAVVH